MNSKVDFAKKNVFYVVLFQLTNILVKFVMRTAFVYYLGKQYLGISGVFSNVISILSLSELGLGSAIVYDLYEPLKNKDYERICRLMKYYRKIYSVIGGFIFIAGFCLIPFLPFILTDVPDVANINIIYMLFLLNTSLSYFFAQYTTIITADQKNYVITKYQLIFSVIKAIIETIILMLTQNYILYLVIEIVLSLFCNVCIFLHAKSLFPFLGQRSVQVDVFCKEKIWDNALSTSSIKIGATVVVGTDNLIISSFVSTIIAGVYSNYAMIISIIQNATLMIENAVIAGIGNVCTEHEAYKYKREVFYKLQFLFATLYVFIFSGLIAGFQPFIKFWVGKEYLLPFNAVIVIAFNCYLAGMHQPIETYVFADGLFQHFKFKPWIEAILNLFISIILAKKIGIIGVLLGTTISNLFTTFWFDALIVYRYSFNSIFSEYIRRYFGYIVTTFVAAFFSYKGNVVLLKNVDNPILQLLCIMMITLLLSGGIWLLVYHKTSEYRYLKNLIKKNIKRV